MRGFWNVIWCIIACSVLGQEHRQYSHFHHSHNLSESVHCPQGNIDVFLIADKSNFPLLAFVLNSISRFMPCSRRINLLVDRGADYRRSKLWIAPMYGNRHLMRVYPFDFPMDVPVISNFSKRREAGYILQAWAMMWADRYSEETQSVSKHSVSQYFHFMLPEAITRANHRKEADYVLFMDTDAILGLPLTCSSLFDSQGRALMLAWPIHMQDQFRGPCQDLTGFPCDRSYMAFFPFLFPMRAFPEVRRHIQQKVLNSGPGTFNEAFNKWAHGTVWQGFSQFVVLGEVLHYLYPDQGRQVMCMPHNRPFATVAYPYASSSLSQLLKTANDSLYSKAAFASDWSMDGKLSETQMCDYFVPPGIHYGWPYQFYMQTTGFPYYQPGFFRGAEVNNRHPVEREFSSKFGPRTVAALTEFVHSGVCFQDTMQTLLQSVSSSADQLPQSVIEKLFGDHSPPTPSQSLLQCKLSQRLNIHPLTNIYNRNRNIPLNLLYATFADPFAHQASEKLVPDVRRHLRPDSHEAHTLRELHIDFCNVVNRNLP